MPARAKVGIGLRQPHYRELLETLPALGFLEVHSENFFAAGGAARAVLREAREHYDISLHGVGLSLGSAMGLDDWHLDRLAELVAEIEPVRVSDHASFARVPGLASGPAVHMNDLLPLAFTPAALDIMVANVQRVQERLKRPLLVENLSAYLSWADDSLAEPEFFNELARRSGCGLLLDVNNLVVNALNRQPDEVRARAEVGRWLEQIDPLTVGEIHLAGYCDTGDLVIDDHGSRVHAPAWAAYEYALHRLGARPTLLEWDTDVPDLSVLLDEAAQAWQRLEAL
ncbi:DUF692 domain-containing protein [Roseateles toxinivorans]|uniref:Uncharacterized protein n=1 Tax=Roseateles toxinivorans TaxID=270368 RepID=A0A4R6QV11_9BURK|nr:DUF692 domain-containing protein [Roseateles toxinivorans]TDP74965.1 hypothetical protein DES47_1011035 [Roseateles toxinivorans]